MNNKLFLKLALSNIRRNKQFYTPYFIACAIIIAMFFTIFNMVFSGSVDNISSGGTMQTMLIVGVVVMGVFTYFFMLYINSFLIKRRKKEFGLYAVLGLEKRHVGRIIGFESFFINMSALIIGIVTGMVFGRLIFMCLMAFSHIAADSEYKLALPSFLVTAVYFAVIFFSNGVYNGLQIRLAKPIDLLKGEQKGEKKARGVIPLTVIGVLLLGSAYAAAILVKTQQYSILLFWPAVVFVILGTFALFKSGSVLVLKLLKKNDKIYYKPKNFISISALMHRFRQNAAGLANICILSTMFIVTISFCCALYFGFDTIQGEQNPNDIDMSIYFYEEPTADVDESIRKTVSDMASEHNIEITDLNIFDVMGDGIYTDINGEIIFKEADGSYSEADAEKRIFYYNVNIVTLEDYNKATSGKETLAENEILLLAEDNICPGGIFDTGRGSYTVKNTYKDTVYTHGKNSNRDTSIYLVAKDKDAAHRLLIQINPLLSDTENNEAYYKVITAVNFEGAYDDRIAFTETLDDEIQFGLPEEAKSSFSYYSWTNIDEARRDNYEVYGGLLFLGIFFSILFLVNTVLVMYFKQISEGYDDRERFVILQKVGMSDEEVRKTINSQVLTVFFLPLIASIFHMLAASNMLVQMLSAFVMTNTQIAIMWILITTAAFSVVYAVIFRLTARTYYKIVKW